MSAVRSPCFILFSCPRTDQLAVLLCLIVSQVEERVVQILSLESHFDPPTTGTGKRGFLSPSSEAWPSRWDGDLFYLFKYILRACALCVCVCACVCETLTGVCNSSSSSKCCIFPFWMLCYSGAACTNQTVCCFMYVHRASLADCCCCCLLLRFRPSGRGCLRDGVVLL